MCTFKISPATPPGATGASKDPVVAPAAGTRLPVRSSTRAVVKEGAAQESNLTSRFRPRGCKILRRNTEPNQVRTNPSSPQPSSNSLWDPRPYQSLCAEHVYLVSSLELQSAIASDLIRQYWSIAEQPQEYDSPKDRRSKRKKLSLIRAKLTSAGNQRKIVSLRLSELAMELHSHNTRVYAQQQARMAQEASSPATTHSLHSLLSIMTDTSGSASACTTPLNAVSPSFVPRRFLESSSPADTRPSSTESSIKGVRLETVDEVGEDFFSNHGLKYEYIVGERLERSTPTTVLWEDSAMPLKSRRLSLPDMQFVWPDD
ncbi:hypothetical protein S40285_07857 [Stachybotrys chlorohalonatus IBT 40285]|uniref:Uncharacterized protein n=1 Tax=Stachybotrys chlorohalonatus (strain IBT 40285) TaxID=1283841 RepID=A0A084Q9H6_STAC4|nr:hypothetical protein S40285_07857 [Stachybotrys chlorohalonata IBT 40285]